MEPRRRASGQAGFTLLELLVTIAILGVVSGVAVFGVGQLTGNAERAACDTEARTITVAQEAYRVQTGGYGDLDGIVGAGLLSERPDLHDVQLVPGGWQLVALGPCAEGADELAAGQENHRDGERAEDAEHQLRRLGTDARAPSSCGPGQVDLNGASADQLTRIVHVNPGRATQIERSRPLSSVEDLRRVEGFNDRRVEEVLGEGLACV